MLKTFAKRAEPTDPVAELRKTLAAIESETPALRKAYGEASLDAETEGTAEAKRKRDAKGAELSKARERVQAVKAAIQTAQELEAERATAKAKAEERQRWTVAAEQAKERAKAAADVEAACGVLMAAYQRLERSSAEIAGLSITKDLDGGMLRRDDVHAAFRLALLRAGFKFAAAYPWPVESLPPLSKRIADANAHLLNQRPAQ